VLTCWDRPAPDTSNPHFMDAFLKHIAFWMDQGVAGWDLDAVHTWLNIKLENVRRVNAYIISRGGMAAPECAVLENPILKNGGYNVANPKSRQNFYNELKAIVEGRADYIREGLKLRKELIENGLFPYQQFGIGTRKTLYSRPFHFKLEMFKQQVAFNAVLPDQVWLCANALTFDEAVDMSTSAFITPRPHDNIGPAVNWQAVEAQKDDPASPFSHMRRMFTLRAKEKALGIGEMEEVRTDSPEDVFAAIRVSEDETQRALVVFNFTERFKRVAVSLRDTGVNTLQNYLNGETVAVSGETFSVDITLFGYKLYKIVE